ncbi:translation initiation factor IF-3 [Patescibacteria group bacterium]|nr:translation initiation factor IF-3 [Patescibacteria group bacterium]MBU1896041.1 translation initiation factor IF-3 [Patescibacteria group bacterium]
MRISRKKRPDKPLIPRFDKNQFIKATEVRLLDQAGENLGILPIAEALSKAREAEMDLVEINPKGNPPVCKLIDFTQFKYQKEKEARKQKAKAHVSEMKGIRLSIRIGEHDMGIREKQAIKFLDRGDKVKIEIILRGRERGKTSLAREVISKFISQLEAHSPLRFEQEITTQGNKMTAIVTKK